MFGWDDYSNSAQPMLPTFEFDKFFLGNMLVLKCFGRMIQLGKYAPSIIIISIPWENPSLNKQLKHAELILMF